MALAKEIIRIQLTVTDQNWTNVIEQVTNSFASSLKINPSLLELSGSKSKNEDYILIISVLERN